MENSYKGSNFKTAFIFLNKKQRSALSFIYSFMRIVDDLADIKNDREGLERLKEEIKDLFKGKASKDKTLQTLKDLIDEYKIPSEVFLKLIQGAEKDLSGVDIKTRAELEDYMYSVAATAGIALLKIVGYDKPNLFDIARETGYALQMTNILRDIKEDYNKKRIYIPLEERLLFFNNYEIDFDSENFKKLFNYEKEIALSYYESSTRLFVKSKDRRLLAPAVMKNIYLELLGQLNFELNPKNHKISNYKRVKAVIKSIREVF